MLNGNHPHVVSADVATRPTIAALPVCPSSEQFVTVAARTDYPVLLVGETGVGKSKLAHLIHRRSARRCDAFVAVNCSALPATLFEREMLGHVRGAFTDAKESQAGFFETADHGTLLLDEIGELPLALQPKLLMLLEDGRVRRLGSTHERNVDVRLIVATNQALDSLVERREFREDLFHRCAVLEHCIPPLRARLGELDAIVSYLLQRIVGPNAPPPAYDDDVRAALHAYDWPGNIRELDNALRHALAHSGNRELRHGFLPERVRCGLHRPGRGPRAIGAHLPKDRYVAPHDARNEQEEIQRALREAGGNRTHAARKLGMSRSTLWAKLSRMGLEGIEGDPFVRALPGMPRAD